MGSKTLARVARPEVSTAVGARGAVLQLKRGQSHALDQAPESRKYAPGSAGSSLAPANPNTGHAFARVPVRPPLPPRVQAKLSVSQPDDKYEQEADRVADSVMRMPEPTAAGRPDDDDNNSKPDIQAKPIAAQITPLTYRRQDLGAESEMREEAEGADAETEEEGDQAFRPHDALQAKQSVGKAPIVSAQLESDLGRLRGTGEPLSEATRAFFEPRFGHDFSCVRVHADGQAAEAASRVNAEAFTHGQDIYFGTGYYQPHSVTGRRLLAHELTHTVQQLRPAAATRSSPGRTLLPSAMNLREDDDSAMRVLPISALQGATLSRQRPSAATPVDDIGPERQEDRETPPSAQVPAVVESDAEATAGRRPEPSTTPQARRRGAVPRVEPVVQPETPAATSAALSAPHLDSAEPSTLRSSSGRAAAAADSHRGTRTPRRAPEVAAGPPHSPVEPSPSPVASQLATLADGIREAAEAEKAAFQQAATQRRAALQQSVADAVARIEASGDARAQALIAQINARRAEVQRQLAVAREQVERVTDQQKQQAIADADAALASIPQMVAEIRQQALDAAETEAGQMEGFGASEARRARMQATQTIQRLNEARRNAAGSVQNTESSVTDAVDAALRRVANESTSDVRDKGERTALAAIDTANEVAASIRSAGQRVGDSDQDTSQLEQGIREAAQAVIAQIDGMRQATLARLDEVERRIASNLDQARVDTVSAVQQVTQEAAGQTQASGRQVLAQLEQTEASVLASIDRVAAQAIARMHDVGSEGEVPPDRIAEARSQVAAGLTQARFEIQAEYLAQADRVEGVLQRGTEQFSGDLAGATASIEQSLAQAASELQIVDAIPADLQTQSEATRAEARQGYTDALQQWMQRVRQPIEQARGEWQAQRERAEHEIRDQVDRYAAETNSMATQATSRFVTTARDAAADANASLGSRIWSGIVEGLGRFWDGLKVFLVAFLIVFAIVAVVLAVVAGGISLAILAAAALIALAIVGIGFLIYGLITGLIHRFGQAWELLGDRPWWEKLLIVTLCSPYFIAVVVGDLIGLTPLLEGIFGYDAMTLEELSTEERWARVTVGLLSILMLLLLWRVGKVLGRAAGRGGGGGEPGEPARRVGEDRPPPVVDPWAALAARYGLRADIVDMMRNSGIEPHVFDRILGRGVDAETAALIADSYGTPGIRVLDALSAAGIETTVAESVIRDANSLGELANIADLAESGLLARLIRRGFDSGDLALLVNELGARGIETIDGLMEGGVQRNPAIECARLARQIGAVDEVHQLARSGNLENPLGLRNFLRRVADEVAGGDQGLLNELREAANRSSSGRVAIGQSLDPRGQADVIDHGRREALQVKTVSAPERAGNTRAGVERVVENIRGAARQIRGEGGPRGQGAEVPPPGYLRIVKIIINNPNNSMFPLDRAALLRALIDNGVTRQMLTGTDPALGVQQLQVVNGTSTGGAPHVYTASEFP